MRILHYEIRICQKSHNTVTVTVYVWTVVRILMKQTLFATSDSTHTTCKGAKYEPQLGLQIRDPTCPTGLSDYVS